MRRFIQVPQNKSPLSGVDRVVHRRSQEAIERRKQKQLEREKLKTQYEIASQIVLNYSWRDPINGEIVFTEQSCKDSKGNSFTFKTFLEKKLLQKFGHVPQHALNHELGELLNRFNFNKIHSTFTYYNRERQPSKNEWFSCK